MSLGYALVGDIGRFDITRIFLEDGLLWMWAVSSSVPKFDGGDCMVRVYSPDGVVFGIIGALPIPKWDLGRHPGTATIEFSFQVVSSKPGDPYMELIR